MSRTYLKSNDESVRKIVQATFPSFHGKEVVACIQDSVQLYGTLWDEGNKRDYVFLSLNTMETLPIPEQPFFERSELHEYQFPMQPGVIVVCLVQSRGKEYLEIISSADNITPLLPAPTDLTEDERTVLIATRSLRSSYNGIKDYRFQEARRVRGITRDRWDAAVETLKGKGFLQKNGAITTDGKNAIGFAQL